MILCGIGLLPLSESLCDHVPELVQPWCADDLATSGKCSCIAQALDFLMEHGSARGYYLEPAKSVLIMTGSGRPSSSAASTVQPGRSHWMPMPRRLHNMCALCTQNGALLNVNSMLLLILIFWACSL